MRANVLLFGLTLHVFSTVAAAPITPASAETKSLQRRDQPAYDGQIFDNDENFRQKMLQINCNIIFSSSWRLPDDDAGRAWLSNAIVSSTPSQRKRQQ